MYSLPGRVPSTGGAVGRTACPCPRPQPLAQPALPERERCPCCPQPGTCRWQVLQGGPRAGDAAEGARRAAASSIAKEKRSDGTAALMFSNYKPEGKTEQKHPGTGSREVGARVLLPEPSGAPRASNQHQQPKSKITKWFFSPALIILRCY